MDDLSVPGDTLPERRLHLVGQGRKKELYRLTEQVNYMRQLFKYRSKTNFIDSKGYMFTYTKTSGLNLVESRKIKKHCEVDGFDVFKVEGIYQPFMVDYFLKDREIEYASIMKTKSGYFLYDLTMKKHDPYRRKI